MRFAILIVAIIFTWNVVYANLFADRKVIKEINKGNYLKALHYSKYCIDPKKRRIVLTLIRNDFQQIYSNLNFVSQNELKLLIDYTNILTIRPDVYLKIVERIREESDIHLIYRLIKSVDKPAWKSMLKQDLRSLKNAE